MAIRCLYLVSVGVILLSVKELTAPPVPGNLIVNPRAKVVTKDDALQYLQRFGYIKTDKTPSDKELENALRYYQKMSDIEVTGKLDKETIFQMNLLRCGAQDTPDPLSKTDVDDLKGPSAGLGVLTADLLRRWWNKCDLNYTLMNETPSRSTEEIREMIGRALKAWEDAIMEGQPPHPDNPPKILSFKELSRDHPHAQISDIQFSFEPKVHGDNNPFDGPFGVLAHAFYPGSGRFTGKVHYDSAEDWTEHSYIGETFYYVTLHELGHSLGLNHSSSRDSIMYSFVRGGQGVDVKLKPEDKQRIQDLYPMRLCDLFSRTRAGARTPPETTTTATATPKPSPKPKRRGNRRRNRNGRRRSG